ncbi:hypothetical protein ACHAXM_003972 [Skeletonema potamos]
MMTTSAAVTTILFLLATVALQKLDAFHHLVTPIIITSHHHHHRRRHVNKSKVVTLHATSTKSTSTYNNQQQQQQQLLSTRIPINESYPGLQQIHSNPDIYIISQFLSPHACDDIISRAKAKGTQRSPVAYAGWTSDFKDLLGLAASGPVSWGAILLAWYESTQHGDDNVVNLVLHALRNYSVLLVMAVILIGGYTKIRADGLQELRTSTSTTLDDLSSSGDSNSNSSSSSSSGTSGVREFVVRSADLFGPPSYDGNDDILSSPASYFEAPTVINYEKDQALAPVSCF